MFLRSILTRMLLSWSAVYAVAGAVRAESDFQGRWFYLQSVAYVNRGAAEVRLEQMADSPAHAELSDAVGKTAQWVFMECSQNGYYLIRNRKAVETGKEATNLSLDEKGYQVVLSPSSGVRSQWQLKREASGTFIINRWCSENGLRPIYLWVGNEDVPAQISSLSGPRALWEMKTVSEMADRRRAFVK